MYDKNIGNPDNLNGNEAKSFKNAYKKMYLKLLRYISLVIINKKVNERLDPSKIEDFNPKFYITNSKKFLYSNYYPLHAAILANADGVVEKLLQCGANIHIGDTIKEKYSLGLTSDNFVYPLHLAVASNNLRMVSLLLNAGAEKEINYSTTNGKTPLAIAIEMGQVEIVKILLEHNAVLSADYQNAEQQNLLHLAAKSGIEEIFKLVFSRDEKMQDLINSTDMFSDTPLHYAAKSDNPAIVKILLDSGAKIVINKRNVHYSTPLHLACASWNYTKHLPLSAPSKSTRRAELVQLLLANGAKESTNLKDLYGYTPLYYAANNGCTESMTLLLSQGAITSLHIKDKHGNTPLHYAAGCHHLVKRNDYDYVSAIQLLLTHGADKDVNEKNTEGKTPYIYAKTNCSEADMKKLFGYNLIGKCTIM